MALIKRGKTWWIRFSHNGERIQRSTGTADKVAAQQLHDKLKSEIWAVDRLKVTPKHSWPDAVMRWLRENDHKRSIKTDKVHLRWLDQHLNKYNLQDITGNLIEEIAIAKENEGVQPSSINRMLEVLRSILRKAHRDWEWLDKMPRVRMRHEDNHRIRWLSHSEAQRLIDELPEHLADMATFTLATGLRASNVTGLQWKNIDLKKGHMWINPDEAKTGKAIAVPLNQVALAILNKNKHRHTTNVFTYNQNPIKQCNTKAWRNALTRAGIKNFRWHDLRHTWASWHVQNGTSLQELQLLGGWSSFEMVLRYAHLSSEHLRSAADRLGNTILRQSSNLTSQDL